MSDKITISFEIDKKDLDAFSQAVTQKFESISNQAKIYKSKNDSPDIHKLESYYSQSVGFGQLYLACIKGLLEISHAK